MTIQWPLDNIWWPQHKKYLLHRYSEAPLYQSQGLKKPRFLEKVFRFLSFLGFLRFIRIQCTKIGQIIITQKFTKNISYMIHPSSCHIIYSNVHFRL